VYVYVPLAVDISQVTFDILLISFSTYGLSRNVLELFGRII